MKRKGPEHVVELQFRLENVEVCAHYGYVVSSAWPSFGCSASA